MRKRRLRFFSIFALFIICLLISTGIYNVYKPLPEGLSFASPPRFARDLKFYKDLTWVDAEGNRKSRQEIFNKVIEMINGAQKIIVLDMFLFNDFTGKEQVPYRKLAKEVTDVLLARKEKLPELEIVVITDPINTVYGGMENQYFTAMGDNNINVVFTRLESLRDSNPIYSSIWRIFIKPFGSSRGTLLPNPFGGGRVSIRSYLSMLNFKANHRKIIFCDSADNYSALITSANPHDGSSAHGNVAVFFKGPAAFDLFQSEKAVLGFSEGPLLDHIAPIMADDSEDQTTIQVIGEGKIKDALISALDRAGKGDKLAIVVFYFSDRDIIHSLKMAHKRGAAIRILLDPNKDAFGRKKNGIPNRQVAGELVKQGIPVRWSNTHGEQSHTKMLLVDYKDDRSIAVIGSANFTRRNLNDLNLETNVSVSGPSNDPFFIDIKGYVDSQWNNLGNKEFSVEYDVYADESFLNRMLYFWMEKTGMSTF